MWDKIMHIIASAVIVIMVWLLVRDLTISSFISLMIGAAKEVHDYRGGGVASWWDIIFDIIGIILGITVVILLG